jgi:hypothetical protein
VPPTTKERAGAFQTKRIALSHPNQTIRVPRYACSWPVFDARFIRTIGIRVVASTAERYISKEEKPMEKKDESS